MAKNDIVLIDSVLHQLHEADPTIKIADHFEKFVLEQVLKSFDLSRDELDFGWTDGFNDGGIDGFYVLINGQLLTDPKDFSWPRSNVEIQVYLFTCKHHTTFQQAPLDSLLASVQELFDLSLPSSRLSGKYSAEIKSCREIFITAFQQLSLRRPALSFNLYYASRGDSKTLGESVVARASQLKSLFHEYFSAAEVYFKALGATELIELHREIKSFSLDLPVQECLTAGDEGYVVLARLQDYSKFVQDEKGALRRYLFDSNVRAFLGANSVNADISETLFNKSGPNFWWLNNGVTILATSASLVGKTLKLRDIQIVNGLQTTESIHRYFSPPTEQSADIRSLLIKVIVSKDETVRDQVIRATNNQSAVEPAALHATDRIQRNIEEILLRQEWFYERRTNFYKNEGKPENRIISPLVLATGSVAILLKNPIQSSKLRQKNIRNPESYNATYSDTFPLEAWPNVAALIRGAENAINKSQRATRAAQGKHLAAWRGVLAFMAAARATGTFTFNSEDIAKLQVEILTDKFMDECWSIINTAIVKPSSAKVSARQLAEIGLAFHAKWEITGNFTDGRKHLPSQGTTEQPPKKEDEAFLSSLKNKLPKQPWKPGVHITVALEMNVKPQRVQNAIKILIARGDFMQQRDGIVFDETGNVVARDPDRV